MAKKKKKEVKIGITWDLLRIAHLIKVLYVKKIMT